MAGPHRGVSGAPCEGSKGPRLPHPPLSLPKAGCVPPPCRHACLSPGGAGGHPRPCSLPAPAPLQFLLSPPQGRLLHSSSNPLPLPGLYFPAGACVSLRNLATRLLGVVGPPPAQHPVPSRPSVNVCGRNRWVERGSPTSPSHPSHQVFIFSPLKWQTWL